MPVEQVKSLYRVNPAELLEWATTRRIPISPAIFRKMNGNSVEQNALSSALETGRVIPDLAGHDRRSIMETLVNGLSLPAGFAKETLIELLLACERLCSTGIGEGLRFLIPVIRSCCPGRPAY